MIHPLTVEPEAQADLDNAYQWYEQQRRGLGARFLDAVEETFDRIRQSPTRFAVVHNDARQALVKKFPYVVCYLFRNGHVAVIAVFHGHRDPGGWQSRVP
jgi:toxin ParE1/3/4